MNFTKLVVAVLIWGLTACATNQAVSKKTTNYHNHPPIKNESLKNRSIYSVEIVRDVDKEQILFLRDSKGTKYSVLSTIGYNAKKKFKSGDKISLIPLKVKKIADDTFMLVSADIKLVE